MIGVCNNSNYMFQCLDYDIYNEKSTSYTKCRTLDRIDLLSTYLVSSTYLTLIVDLRYATLPQVKIVNLELNK